MTAEQASRERILSEARAIGDRLCELALHDDGSADWIGLTQAAFETLAYERSSFSNENRNWLDLRRPPQMEEEQAPRTGMSWSHGAPGIALARLASLCYMDDEVTRQEIETVLTTILEEGFGYHHEHIGPNHSLAHGDFGNLETLLMAAQTLNTPQLHTVREHITVQLVESINQNDEMRQMGHTTLAMTNEYATLTVEHLRRSHEMYSPLRAKDQNGEEAAERPEAVVFTSFC